MLVVVFEVLIEVAWFTRITAASSFIKLPCLMVNTEEPVWKDKGQRSLFHQHLLSELSADGKKPPAVLHFTPIPQRQYHRYYSEN